MRRIAGFELLTPEEAAEFCECSRRSLYRWLQSGKLEGYKAPNNRWLVEPHKLADYLTQGAPADVKEATLKQIRDFVESHK